MGRPAGWKKELTGRAPMKSPGKPSLRRDVERLFWGEISKGLTSEEAAIGPVHRWIEDKVLLVDRHGVAG